MPLPKTTLADLFDDYEQAPTTTDPAAEAQLRAKIDAEKKRTPELYDENAPDPVEEVSDDEDDEDDE